MTQPIPWNGGGLLEEVRQRSGAQVSACFQCHKCSTGCPIGPEMDFLPSQIMRLVHLGAENEVLGSRSIWLCASCEACTTRCPMAIDIAAVMDALRILAIERRIDLAGRPRETVPSQLPGQRSPPRPRVRDGHDDRLQAAHPATCSPTWTRSRRCWPRANSRCCPTGAETSGRCARSSGGRKRRKGNREVRVLPRLQSRVHGAGLRPLHAGGLPARWGSRWRISRTGSAAVRRPRTPAAIPLPSRCRRSICRRRKRRDCR